MVAYDLTNKRFDSLPDEMKTFFLVPNGQDLVTAFRCISLPSPVKKPPAPATPRTPPAAAVATKQATTPTALPPPKTSLPPPAVAPPPRVPPLLQTPTPAQQTQSAFTSGLQKILADAYHQAFHNASHPEQVTAATTIVCFVRRHLLHRRALHLTQRNTAAMKLFCWCRRIVLSRWFKQQYARRVAATTIFCCLRRFVLRRYFDEQSAKKARILQLCRGASNYARHRTPIYTPPHV